MGEGTEAFPELGKHCQHPECNQLDFLPFNCDSCHKVFCLDHKSYKSHECPKSDQNSRKVIVCGICSISMETTGKDGDDEALILEKHKRSGDCDPRKKKKPTCSAGRCREVLTFSNTSICKICGIRVCLKHRFPADHACEESKGLVCPGDRSVGSKFLAALASRNAVATGQDCGKEGRSSGGSVSSPRNPSVKAC